MSSIHPENRGLYAAWERATQQGEPVEPQKERFALDESIRNAVAQVLYETEAGIPCDDGGFAWKHLHPLAKDVWRARAELAIETYHTLTTKQYQALTEEEIKPHVDKCNAEIQARLEQV